MAFETLFYTETDTGTLEAGEIGGHSFEAPMFDPELGTLMSVEWRIGGAFSATADATNLNNDGEIVFLDLDLEAVFGPDDDAITFEDRNFTLSDRAISFFLTGTSEFAFEDSGQSSFWNADTFDGATGTDSYTMSASYSSNLDVAVGDDVTAALTSLDYEFTYGLLYTYLPVDAGGGDNSADAVTPERAESADIGGGQRITYVSKGLPTLAPVTPLEPLEYTYQIDQFDPARGTLSEATVVFYGAIISTAILQDLFGSGNVQLGSATANVAVAFEETAGGPTFESQTLEVVATGFTSFFDTTALPLNATSNTLGTELGNLSAAVGDGTYGIKSTQIGNFIPIPFGSLPQQAFIPAVEVGYVYTPSAGSRFGTDSANSITGTNGANWIETYAGNDRVATKGGDDTVLLGEGNDYVRVGGGEERFFGGAGKDYISYYDSANGITANLEADTISGSWAVNDTISSFESISGSRTGDDSIIGTSGSNTINTFGGNDRVAAGGGSDVVELGSGNDYVRVGGGKETFDGGSGTDYISYFDSANGIRIDLRDDEVSGSWAVNDTIEDFESASGSGTGGDTMLGTNGANTLKGFGGDDKLYGRSGADKLYGGDGEDFLDGGGGSGTDQLYGGADADVFHFDRGEGVDIVKDFENNIDTVELDNFGLTKTQALALADQVGSDVVFDFGADGMLTIENTTIGKLTNDLDIV